MLKVMCMMNLHDPELRYRQRYVDLIVNPQVKNTFLQRSKVTTIMTSFFNDQKGYLEVETPILQPIPGGASARPFITHHNALNTPLYLRVANELYLKKIDCRWFRGSIMSLLKTLEMKEWTEHIILSLQWWSFM